MPVIPTVAGHLSRSRAAVTHHRRAKRSLERTGSARSRHGLDWMIFFCRRRGGGLRRIRILLADLGWSKEPVGLAMTVGRITGALVLLPGGALTDALPWKRGLAQRGS
jgi:hypothetical protein